MKRTENHAIPEIGKHTNVVDGSMYHSTIHGKGYPTELSQDELNAVVGGAWGTIWKGMYVPINEIPEA